MCFDHGVGQERLPLDSAHREDRDAAVLREFAQPVGEVALPLPPQSCDPMRGNTFEETVRNSQPPHVVQSVQQPVSVCGVVPGFELPEPHEARHAVVDRLLEQAVQAVAQIRPDPLGDASFDTAFRVHECIRTQPLDRRCRWQDRVRAPALVDEPAYQVLVRACEFSLAPQTIADCARGTARERPEPVQPVQLGKVIVASFDPCRVVREVVPVEVKLAADEVHDRARHEFARRQQAPGITQDAQLQRETQLVAGPAPGGDVVQILIAQRVVAQQLRLALGQGEQGRPLSAGQYGPACHRFFL